MKLGAFRDPRAALDETRRLVERFNDNRTGYPRDRGLPALFAEQAAARPDAVAVIDADGRGHTYAGLDAAANRFARLLLDCGLAAEDRVAVMADDAFASAAAIVGTLKAGGAYVPIDPRTPYERVRYVVDDTGARVLAVGKRDLRVANRLHWQCPRLDVVFCVDSRDVRREPEGVGLLMQEPIWDHAAETAGDDDIAAGGWTSSYTGETLARDVMDAYGDSVRAKLKPYLTPATRLLEIACGSGISLRRLAPLVGDYCATDLSRAVIEWTRREVVLREGLANVRLHHVPAHRIDQIDRPGDVPDGGFDVVVMNSVVQCFSGYHYLRDVIGKAIALMADRGTIFLGDLLDLELKDRFVASIAEFRARHPDKGRRAKVDRSEDLFVPRAFLDDLRHDFPEIVAIESSRLIGDAESELSEYGYDAILHVDKRRAAAPTAPRTKRQLDLADLDRHDAAPVADATGPHSLAYVIYTSGTLGRPKGVMVEHRAVTRLVVATDYVRLGPDVRILQTGSIAFDASTFEIWAALLNGGATCRPPERAILDPNEVARWIAAHGITTMWLTAGLFNRHVDSGVEMFGGLSQLIVGGDRLSPPHVERVRARHPRLALINGYGPTENTTFTTAHRIDRAYATEIPIGRPIANTQVLIVDAQGAPVGVGVAGEICCAGDGLARGYLGDPELTRRKFVAHPWLADQRIYRTGDAGLWRADGTIEFLGRLDDQVKIRGFRVEPAEIECRILDDATIRQARVVARKPDADADPESDEPELVAYVVFDGDASDERLAALRDRLKRTLPDYMVPAHLMALDAMPLNANGKVDAKALPDPRPAAADPASRFDAPANEVERALAAIFAEVLGVARVGATDDFFDRGGHSLKVTKAVASIERRLGVALPLRTFFMSPTVRALAARVVDAATFGVPGIDDAIVPLNRADRADGPPLFLFPPGTGDAIGFVQLAALLRCPCHGFNFIEAATRIADYADLIEGTDPEGPHLLAGYSSGGNLAYQVARELERRGREVAAIVMIDSARQLVPTPLDDAEIDRAAAAFLADPGLAPYLASPVLREKAARLVRASLAQVGRLVDDPATGAEIHVIESDGAVTELRGDDGTLWVSQNAWTDATTGGVHVHRGFGDHNRMLWPPHLERNAELIGAIVERVGLGRSDRAVGRTVVETVG